MTELKTGTRVFYKDGKEVVEATIVEACYSSNWVDDDYEFTGDYIVDPVNTETCWRNTSVQNEDDISTNKSVILQNILIEINKEQRVLAEQADKILAKLILESVKE